MTVRAIIHSATCVVIGLTTDEKPAIGKDCEIVETVDARVLADGATVLSADGAISRADAAAIRAAFAGTGLADDMADKVSANGLRS